MDGAALHELAAALAGVLGLRDASPVLVGDVADLLAALGVERDRFEAQVDDWRTRAVVITAEVITQVAAERRS